AAAGGRSASPEQLLMPGNGAAWHPDHMRRDQAHLAGGAATTPERYEFQVLGSFAVHRCGERLPDQAVGSRKARTLLKRLLVARHRVVSVAALADAVWPQHPPAAPERHVATLVSRVRATLGAGVVVREGAGYRFGAGACRDRPGAGTAGARRGARRRAGGVGGVGAYRGGRAAAPGPAGGLGRRVRPG